MERDKLADLVTRFTEAFNSEDLDGVMSFMAEETRAGWRGLDILHVENGRITQKLTYAKARVPLLEEKS